MELSDLSRLPRVPLPEGYNIRTFRAGDEAGLAAIFADGALGLDSVPAVQSAFLSDYPFRPERVFVAEYGEELVGTAAMWTSRSDPDHAYLHMVAVLTPHRGKYLGWALSTAAARHAAHEGYTTQRLFTDDFREAAIRLYLEMGYAPLYLDDTHPARWAAVLNKLKRPELLSRARRGQLGRPRGLLTRVRGRLRRVLGAVTG